MTNDDIVAAIPRPWLPYAKRQIGKPMFPVFGKINGGSSVIISLFRNLRNIIPVIAKPKIANKEYQKYSTKILNVNPVVVTA